MPCHGRGRVIQHYQHNVVSVIHCIYHSGYPGGKECRVSDKSEINCIRLDHMKSLGNGHPRAHAQTSVYHIKRLCITECIASDIPAEYRLLSLHGLFYCVERSPVGTSGAEHRRTHGKFRRFLSGRRISRGIFLCFLQKTCNIFPDTLCTVFSGIFRMSGKLSIYVHRQMMPSRDLQQFSLDHWIQFFQHKHLIQFFQKPDCQLLREGMGRGDLQKRRPLRKHFSCIGVADTACHDPLLFISLQNKISFIAGQSFRQFRISLFNLYMIQIGCARENNPAHGIFDKSFRSIHFQIRQKLNAGTCMTDSCSRTEQYRSLIFFRKLKCLADHLVSLFR